MKFLLKVLITLGFGLGITFAHPLDVSNSIFSIKGNVASVTTYFHSFEIEYLLSKNGIKPQNIQLYYDNQKLIEKYISQNISFINDNNSCVIQDISMPRLQDRQVLSKGVEFNYNFICNTNISKAQININFFTNFDLQTNRLTIYNLNNGIVNLAVFDNRILTSKITNYELNLQDKSIKMLDDKDGDGIVDQEELIYKTDPNKVDSDNDLYTDYEEIISGRNPINPSPSPGQSPKDSATIITSNQSIITGANNLISNNIKDNNSLANLGFGMSYLNDVLKEIQNYVSKTSDKGFFWIFVMVVILGFIHAIGPGHSKNIMITYILDKDRDFMDGIMFSLIFTITHLIDIVLLYMLTRILFNYIDLSTYILGIQKISLIALVVFSGYLVYKNFVKIKCQTQASVVKNKGNNWIIGIVSGLAPCSFGWGMFMLLYGLGSYQLIPWLLLALGIGIFLCLFILMLVTLIVRKSVYSRANLLSNYSGILSSVIMLFVGIYLLYLIV